MRTVSDFIIDRLIEWDLHRYYGFPGDGIGGLDGAFLTMYGVGCAIFLYILMGRTQYSSSRASSAVAQRGVKAQA